LCLRASNCAGRTRILRSQTEQRHELQDRTRNWFRLHPLRAERRTTVGGQYRSMPKHEPYRQAAISVSPLRQFIAASAAIRAETMAVVFDVRELSPQIFSTAERTS